jgi:hypothetical protein|tara:strand:- start:1234 stop:1437 length:204 start_codon:yes stop_codon:yes gene_type:complete
LETFTRKKTTQGENKMKVEEKIEKNIEKTLRKLGRAMTNLDCLEAYSDLQRFCTHYELQKKSEKENE